MKSDNLRSNSMQLIEVVLNAVSMLTRTRLNYWAEFAVNIPLGAVLFAAGLWSNELGPVTVILTILLGLFLFSLLEYAFHRWLFHGPVQIMARGHRSHHLNPQGFDALPFFLPLLVLLALNGILLLVMPAPYAFLLTGTITLSYEAYGLSHFIIHHHRFHTALGRNWAARHHIHHFHGDTNFGVTTPLWDIVFGTRYRRVSR